MRCTQCGSPDMVTRTGDYHYTESGLNNVILKGVTLHECEKCDERSPVIPQVKLLHEKIAITLLGKPSPLTGDEIRFLRKEMRFKASDLAILLGVHKVSLSRWETDAEPIGASTDRLLRYMYATRYIEDLAKRISILNVTMLSNTIQGTMRWFETRLKFIKRKSTQETYIAIEASDMASEAFDMPMGLLKPGCLLATSNVIYNLDSCSPWPCQALISNIAQTRQWLFCLHNAHFWGHKATTTASENQVNDMTTWITEAPVNG